DGGKVVGVLPGALARRLLAPPLAFTDHRLAKFPGADTMRLEQGPRKAVFKDEGGSWKMTEPLATDVDHDAMQAFHDGLAGLRADELVREKPAPADLERYGLGKRPAARWRLASGDDVVLDLTVGAEEKGGRRRYARLAGKELVFLLDPTLSAAAVAEYRPRKIWKTPLDASRVESIHYGYPGGKAFELKNGSGGWQAVGQPGVWVTEAAVPPPLAALRDPMLVRYVVDKGANLALYGLKPPDLALELTTSSGAKYTLHVGGLEEGSKRRYARLPEPGRSDVFLLDEADAARIVRGLAAFRRAAEPYAWLTR